MANDVDDEVIVFRKYPKCQRQTTSLTHMIVISSTYAGPLMHEEYMNVI